MMRETHKHPNNDSVIDNTSITIFVYDNRNTYCSIFKTTKKSNIVFDTLIVLQMMT